MYLVQHDKNGSPYSIQMLYAKYPMAKPLKGTYTQYSH